jgi:hypothetical protein
MEEDTRTVCPDRRASGSRRGMDSRRRERSDRLPGGCRQAESGPSLGGPLRQWAARPAGHGTFDLGTQDYSDHVDHLEERSEFRRSALKTTGSLNVSAQRLGRHLERFGCEPAEFLRRSVRGESIHKNVRFRAPLAPSLRYYPMPPRLFERKTIGHEPPIGPFDERLSIVCAHHSNDRIAPPYTGSRNTHDEEEKGRSKSWAYIQAIGLNAEAKMMSASSRGEALFSPVSS